VNEADWQMAQQRIINYRKHMDGTLKSPLLMVTVDDSQPVNLGVWFMFGYYLDYRSHVDLILVKEFQGKRDQYKMADRMIEDGKSRSITFRKEHDLFNEIQEYKGIAVYVCSNFRAVEEDVNPFQKYLQENGLEQKVYCMKYYSNELLTENHRFEEATNEIRKEIRKYHGKIGVKTEEPKIYFFMNVAAAMALSLGRQLGNFGNIQLCGFSNKEHRYYPAILLQDKNKA
jgi:hypothetical protein